MLSTFTASYRGSRYLLCETRRFGVMKKTAFVLFLLVLGACLGFGREIKDIPNVHIADRTKFLSNPDAIISPRAQSAADSIMGDIWRKSTAEIVAVVIDSISGVDDPDTFVTNLFETWGIGKKDNDNGLLLFVSIKDRVAVIRTGYGMEGTVPDIVAGSIIRHDLTPYFKQGDYDTGVLNSLASLHTIITNPEAAEELKSKYANDEDVFADDEAWTFYLYTGVFCLAAGLLFIILSYYKNRRNPELLWSTLSACRLPFIIVTIFFIGIPLPSLLVLLLLLRKIRKGPFHCKQCSGKMHRLDTSADWRFLNPQQLTERRLNSVEHEVWECSDCGNVEVKSYKNPNTVYRPCKLCGTVASHQIYNRTIVPPTTLSTGTGELAYKCEHCGHIDRQRYQIARKTPVVVIGGGGFGGGGGFSGGSFGGGHTGGGGASGHW